MLSLLSKKEKNDFTYLLIKGVDKQINKMYHIAKKKKECISSCCLFSDDVVEV